jgi:hypothetical protein
MKKQIENIRNYFKTQLLKNDFEIVEVTESKVILLIEGYEFHFLFWKNKNWSVQQYKYYLSFLDLSLSPLDEVEICNVIIPKIQDRINSAKLAKIEELKKEIGL